MMLRIRTHSPKKPIAKASVAITFFAENRRRFELSNAAESVMDLLVDAAILEDDCATGIDPTKPRAEVEITPQAL